MSVGEADLEVREDARVSEPVAMPVAEVASLPIMPVAEPTTELVAEPEEPAEVDDRVGTYVSDKAVLLRYDEESDQWQRLPSRASLAAGDRLLALPTFRPTIALGTGLTLQLAGGSSVILEGPDAEGIPMITVGLAVSGRGDPQKINAVACNVIHARSLSCVAAFTTTLKNSSCKK